MNPLDLSVVLPVYNMAPYLRQCLDSLAKQDRPFKEIIAVDDGSTDESPAILAEYAANRLPTLNIIRQDNGGHSVARNTGMAAATGRWVYFMDSDDFLEPDALSQLASVAEHDHLDIALCNARYHYEGRKHDHPIHSIAYETTIEPGKDWVRNRLRQGFFPHMVWMHLYRREFLLEHNFRFIPGQVHEDVIWTNQVMLAAQKVRYVDGILYNYRIRQMRSGADLVWRSREYVIPCSVRNTQEISGMADALSDDKELEKLMRGQAFSSGNAVIHLIEKLPEKGQRAFHIRKLKNEGFFSLMRHNATTISQHRKLLRIQLKFLCDQWF